MTVFQTVCRRFESDLGLHMALKLNGRAIRCLRRESEFASVAFRLRPSRQGRQQCWEVPQVGTLGCYPRECGFESRPSSHMCRCQREWPLSANQGFESSSLSTCATCPRSSMVERWIEDPAMAVQLRPVAPPADANRNGPWLRTKVLRVRVFPSAPQRLIA